MKTRLVLLTLIYLTCQIHLVSSENRDSGRPRRNDFDVSSILKQVEEIRDFVNGAQTSAEKTREVKKSPGTFVNLYAAVPGQNFLADGFVGLVEETLGALQAVSYNVSELCLKNFNQTLTGLLDGEMWALKMIDSNAKPPSGILELKTKWVGSHHECVSTKAEVYEDPETKTGLTHPFSGQYCTVNVPIKIDQIVTPGGVKLEMGMCFPDSCTDYDASILANLLFSVIPLKIIPEGKYAYAVCKEEFPTKLSSKAIAVVVVCSLFAAVMILATLYDILIVHRHLYTMFSCSEDEDDVDSEPVFDAAQDTEETTPLISDVNMSSSYTQNGAVSHYKSDCEKVRLELGRNKQTKPKTKEATAAYKPSTLESILLSFSIYTNTSKIFNTSQPAGALTAVNGLRFISMTWVILGHTFAFGFGLNENNAYVGEVIKRFTFQAVINATVSVDTFFVLSGLLVAYLSLKQMEKLGGALRFRWDLYYFHRVWRLTPPYMLVLMVYVPLFKYLYSGPFWTDISQDECSDTWWKNLLYVNNLVNPKDQCMGWSWYLANDMQFYILSPLVFVPLYYSGVLGTLVCLAFLLATMLSTGLISKHKDLAAGDQPFNDVYVKPWIRIGPYIIGLFTGYILYKTKCKVRMHKLLNLLGWAIATALALAVLYGLYRAEGVPSPSLGVAALYNATFRTAWGVCVAWVVFACATGYGGPVNVLLSWKALIPLSRLTYCAYLVHPVVMYMYYNSHQTYMYWSDLEVTYIFIGHLVLSYATAYVTSLAFEAPMMGLEKVLLGRAKSS